MDKARLEEHLRAGNSLEQKPSGKVDSDRLRELVEADLSIRAIADELGVSNTTVRHWLDGLGLVTTRMARYGQFAEARRRGLRQVERRCSRHGIVKHVMRADGAFRCVRCRSEAVSRRRRRVKEILVAEAGGQCRICGYQRCIGALQFHHLNPDEKEFVVSLRGATRGIDVLRREAAKCVLLCANCHAEVENRLSEVPIE